MQHFELRRLDRRLAAARMKRTEAEALVENLRANLAIALEERAKIFASRTWRLAQFLQRVIAGPRRVLDLRRSTPPNSGRHMARAVASDISTAPLSPEDWLGTAGALSANDRAVIVERLAGLTSSPLISVILPDGTSSEARLQSVRSLEAQLYPNWELCTQAAQVGGAFVAFLEPGERLAEEALFEVAWLLDAYPETDFLYTDEDRVDTNGRHRDPVFKPGFSLDILLAGLLPGGLAVYRRTLLETVGFTLEGLPLRAALKTSPDRIRHVPQVLLHRPGTQPTHATFDDTPFTTAEIPNLAGVYTFTIAGGWRRVLWPLPDPLPRVSVIIPTRDRADLLSACVSGLLQHTDYPDIEVIILDNDSREPAAVSLFRELSADPRVRILPVPGAFNFSKLNNFGVAASTGAIIVMLNNDIEVIESSWLKEMVSHAVRPDVGAVGARLLYPDGRVQHAGVVLGVGEHDGGPGVAGHFGHFADGDEDGYLGQYAVVREVSAVTGACLALRREVWDAIGGLDEVNLPVTYNDVDLCLRIRERGWRIIWTPFAELLHLESATRAQDRTPDQIAKELCEARYMRDRWGENLDADPFYNANFDRRNHLFQRVLPPHPRSWQLERSAGTGTGGRVKT